MSSIRYSVVRERGPNRLCSAANSQSCHIRALSQARSAKFRGSEALSLLGSRGPAPERLATPRPRPGGGCFRVGRARNHRPGRFGLSSAPAPIVFGGSASVRGSINARYFNRLRRVRRRDGRRRRVQENRGGPPGHRTPQGRRARGGELPCEGRRRMLDEEALSPRARRDRREGALWRRAVPEGREFP